MNMIRTIKILLIFLVISLQAYGQLDQVTKMNIEKAVDYFNSEEYAKALIFTNKLLEKDDANYSSWVLKGRILFNIGNHKEAVRAINKAIELNPNYYEAYGFRAIMYDLIGNYDMTQVIRDVNISLADDPDNFDLIAIKASFLYKTGQFEEALEEYDRLLKIEVNNYSIVVFHASTNKKLGNQDIALDGYNKAIAIDSNQDFAYTERAFFFLEQEKYLQAIEDYDKVLQVIGTDEQFKKTKAYTFNNRGFAYHNAGNNGQALIDINRSLDLLPTNSYAFKNRALVYFVLAFKEKGCADLYKAVELGYTHQYGEEVENLILKFCK